MWFIRFISCIWCHSSSVYQSISIIDTLNPTGNALFVIPCIDNWSLCTFIAFLFFIFGVLLYFCTWCVTNFFTWCVVAFYTWCFVILDVLSITELHWIACCHSYPYTGLYWFHGSLHNHYNYTVPLYWTPLLPIIFFYFVALSYINHELHSALIIT